MMKNFIADTKGWLRFSPTSQPRKILRILFIKLKFKISKYKIVKKYSLLLLETFPSIKTNLYRLLNPKITPSHRIIVHPDKIIFLTKVKNDVENRKSTVKGLK